MNYTETEFENLMTAVRNEGGEHLDRQCKARTYDFSGPQTKPVTIGACGNSTIFKLPYEALSKSGATVTLHSVEVCAVDDDIGRWPRFGGDRFGR